MSLYHEAAGILQAVRKEQASVKSLVFSKKGWKSDPKTLFALSTEAAKWSEVLSEALEKSGILGVEKQLTPELALVLTHDLFLSKKGIALPASHGLYTSVSKHKVRLSAELTKARLRRGCASLDQLRAKVDALSSTISADGESNGTAVAKYPRWVRINTIKTSLQSQLGTTFADYSRSSTIKGTLSCGNEKRLHIDKHIPNLVAVSPNIDLTTTKAYKSGHIILQDKASCFPAYLLNPGPTEGDVIDACAAPGNKTTHVAAILAENDNQNAKVIACEKNDLRSQTLAKMTKLAGGEKSITVKAKQDFMRLDPSAKEFHNVTALLLDPSCSGSGIVGRDGGGLTVHLPNSTSTDNRKSSSSSSRGKKRKRQADEPSAQPHPPPAPILPTSAIEEQEEQPLEEEEGSSDSANTLQTRLTNLSTFQFRLLQHAMAFPSARKISYSTCSVHFLENENVVLRALQSSVAREQGWRILRREEQVDGMRKWGRRGWRGECEMFLREEGDGGGHRDARGLAEEVAEGCIRCEKDDGRGDGTQDEEGTMGFFVAGFVREDGNDDGGSVSEREVNGGGMEEDGDEWEGFDD
ncbi:S-adenosyl-L-methionine-dependent methyltransferase [Hortaea werneckii]|nr:S-adenosyl-L-methionine-dependent methyltransferase [Hortaea werneckii]KAI7095180.1 S-adenosyl-L-methionine-dependent methyltransferase [Hortaea werneckii]KAI7233921.1 S-adenosyl-L-methionine-dependent methyltransferase [Hortaea werneckii]KAI7315729.1 S-adenosyl-L-methionine-dependent methyltransferase [Hortaea werneckii]KAI7397495.1 S-adenosyl-L-methionine-dependent methyltransferase [Hortaea werneckii]